MTALDQAFIKAFARQETVPLAVTPRPLSPAKTSPQESRDVRREEPHQKAAPVKPQAVAAAEPLAAKRQGPEVVDRRSPIGGKADARTREPEVALRAAPMLAPLPATASFTAPAVALGAAPAAAPAPAIKIAESELRPREFIKPQPIQPKSPNVLSRPPLAPLSAHAAGTAFQTPSTVRVTRLDEVWAALERTATLADSPATVEVEEQDVAKQVVTGPCVVANEDVEREALNRTTPPTTKKESETVATDADWRSTEEVTTAQWSSTIEPFFAQSSGFDAEASAEPQPPICEPASEERETKKVVPELPKPSIVLPVVEPEFKPAWQVDHFTWPKLCRRLIAKATDELDRLADAYLALQGQGQKVLAMGACQSGEGATTMLLCAAHRLAERGVKTVLVDADLNRPRLANRLGVQPQIGWDETTDEEGRSLDHAIIEAMENNLSLLPLREPSDEFGRAPGDPTRLAACVKVLRDHYDMVLVDLGPLQDAGLIEDKWGWLAAGTIDSVVLVQNRHVTSEQQQMALESQLAVAGVAVAGIVENFVADE